MVETRGSLRSERYDLLQIVHLKSIRTLYLGSCSLNYRLVQISDSLRTSDSPVFSPKSKFELHCLIWSAFENLPSSFYQTTTGPAYFLGYSGLPLSPSSFTICSFRLVTILALETRAQLVHQGTPVLAAALVGSQAIITIINPAHLLHPTQKIPGTQVGRIGGLDFGLALLLVV